jgi:hypothetical protein
MNTKSWSGNLEERDHFRGLDLYGRIILELDLREIGCEMWTGFFRLKVGSSGGMY